MKPTVLDWVKSADSAPIRKPCSASWMTNDAQLVSTTEELMKKNWVSGYSLAVAAPASAKLLVARKITS